MAYKMTASCSFGKTAIGHDNRKFLPGNVDKALSSVNEYLIRCDSIREAYHEIFDEAVQAYNDSQKRNDRKIDDYYDKINKSKNGEHLAYEYVLQVGSHDTNPTGGEWQELSKEIYKEWLNDFTEHDENLKVINAAIHCDEPNGTPHMHITIVPVAHSSRGLSLKNSLSGAMKEMGYSRASDWCLDVQKELGEKLLERGIEYEQLGTHREHIENGLFQELMDREREKVEVALEDVHEEIKVLKDEKTELSENVSFLKEEVKDLNETIEEKQGFLKRIENGISELIAKFRGKIEELSGALLAHNTQQRIEKVLRMMPADFITEFKERWNMFDNDLPCFRLEYDAPSVEGIREKYFAEWENVFNGKLRTMNAFDATYDSLLYAGFTTKEIRRIVDALGSPFYVQKEDVEAAVKCTENILMERHIKRIKATPEELKEKYLRTEISKRKMKIFER